MRRTTLIYYLAFLSITIGASAALPSAIWGAGAWSSISFTLGLVIALSLLALVSRRLSDRVLDLLPGGSSLPRPAVFIAFPLLVILLWLLRPTHLLLGGLQELVARTAEGAWTSPAAPLATAMTQAVFRAINSLFFIRPETAISIFSVLLSVPFVLAARSIALTLTSSEEYSAREWLPAAAMIFAGGYSIVFFGGNSVLAVSVTLSALFVLSSLKHLKGEIPLHVPLSVFLVSLFAHYSNIFLAPGAAWLLIRALKSKKSRPEAAALGATVLIALAIFDIVLSSIETVSRPSAVLSAAVRGSFESISSRSPGSTFSDWGNVLLVLGPVVVYSMILVFTGKRRERSDREKESSSTFLTLTSFSALLLILAASSLVRHGLRWEVFASTGPAFASLALVRLKKQAGNSKEAAHGALIVLLVSLFHLTALAGLNVSRTRGIDRLQTLPLSEGVAEKIVGIDLMATENYEEAAEWLGRAGEVRENDSEIWFALGLSDIENEDILDAISHFNRAVKISPDDPEYREELAEAYIEKRWFDEAVSELEILTGDHPSETRYMIRLGYAYNHGGMYDQAVSVYEKILESEPGNMQYRRNLASSVLNLGAAFHEDKDYGKAEESYRRVLTLLPTSWVAKNNLAMVYMDREDYDEAYRILEDAISGNDLAARLHFNMALVQEQRGEYQDAFDHLSKSVELSPGMPAPEDIMRRIWKKAEAQKEESDK